jgi:hypothetical protein
MLLNLWSWQATGRSEIHATLGTPAFIQVAVGNQAFGLLLARLESEQGLKTLVTEKDRAPNRHYWWSVGVL